MVVLDDIRVERSDTHIRCRDRQHFPMFIYIFILYVPGDISLSAIIVILFIQLSSTAVRSRSYLSDARNLRYVWTVSVSNYHKTERQPMVFNNKTSRHAVLVTSNLNERHVL